MLILIDNYDSFTYNIVQYFGDLGANIKIYRNDKITVDDVIKEQPSGIVLSPGPGTPDDLGICLDLIKKADIENIPLLGVCLGHQAIGQVYGGNIIQTQPKHGKTSEITHNQEGIFKSIPRTFTVTRYHSLIIDPQTMPRNLNITAQTSDGIIMGLEHTQKPIFGVQFHPESIATEHGHQILKNFMKYL